MRVRLIYTVVGNEEDVIDLKDYGYSANTAWEDLTEDQRLEITQEFEEQCHVGVIGETEDIDNHEEGYFDKDEDEDGE